MSNYKVLVADDERMIREGIAEMISWGELGLTLTGTAPDGAAAFRDIVQQQPDIVITDIKMPKLNGLELIQQAQKECPDIAFIVLSGYGEFELAAQAMRFGVKHYLLKPSNEEEIIQVLQEVTAELDATRMKERQIEGMRRQLEQRERQGAGEPMTVSASASAFASPSALAVTDDSATAENEPARADSRAQVVVSKIKQLTAEHLENRQLSLQWMAQHHLFLNSEYLGKLFRQETGEKFTRYLTAMRMEKAKELMAAHSQLKIYEIAERCGFEQDPQYFTNVFKKEVGVSPVEYRKRLSRGKA
ncbi:response regulator [Paenibacillus sp. NPDC058071]|uniref:response regulator transcription factor n=1 Tax=Paenibacillus sp. NPDC058071 TaxID=3346326 RepID=UPI0036DBE458